MRYFLSGIVTLALFCCACSSTPKIATKGADLSSLEAQANYITTKNVCKKLADMKINFIGNPFLLGAFDIRDGIPSRVPEENYETLLTASRAAASPIAQPGAVRPDLARPDLARPDQTEAAADEELPNGLRTVDERVSYLTAREIAKSFGKNGIPVLPASMALGLADTLSTDAPRISPAEEKLMVKMIKEKIDQPEGDWAENRKQYYMAEEKSFFANNITKPDVVSLNSGVQYIVTKKGGGKIPKAKDSVVVNYRGLLLDGKEFDSSYKRKSPDTFALDDMIPGFTQALTQVPEGSTLIIFIPAALAYGEKGTTGIPPYAAISFEVEFINIKKGFF